MAFRAQDHLINLKGKDYLQVAWRLVWFREEKPLWSIDPVIIELDADHAIFRACIFDESGVQKCAAHGSESKRDFGDYIEKAETKAVGRALAMLGYGTQFTATELDEGDRIVDSPLTLGSKAAADRVGADKLAQIEKQIEAAATTGAEGAKLAARGQIEFIKANATDEELARLRGKYGNDLERMTMQQAARNIAVLQKRLNGGKMNE